jgi:hypothetical protein
MGIDPECCTHCGYLFDSHAPTTTECPTTREERIANRLSRLYAWIFSMTPSPAVRAVTGAPFTYVWRRHDDRPRGTPWEALGVGPFGLLAVDGLLES